MWKQRPRAKPYYSREQADLRLRGIMEATRAHSLPYEVVLEQFRDVAARTSAGDLDAIATQWFEHVNPSFRMHAATLTRIIGEKNLMLHLIRLLSDRRHGIRANAIRTLDEQGFAKRNIELFELLLAREQTNPKDRESPDVLSQIIEVFGKHGKRKHEELVREFTNHAHSLVRTTAKRALEKMSERWAARRNRRQRKSF